MEINFNDWEFYDLSKELNEMTVMQMLERHQQLNAGMKELSAKYLKVSGNERRQNEKEYDTLHRKQVFVAVRIVESLTEK